MIIMRTKLQMGTCLYFQIASCDVWNADQYGAVRVNQTEEPIIRWIGALLVMSWPDLSSPDHPTIQQTTKKTKDKYKHIFLMICDSSFDSVSSSGRKKHLSHSGTCCSTPDVKMFLKPQIFQKSVAFPKTAKIPQKQASLASNEEAANLFSFATTALFRMMSMQKD